MKEMRIAAICAALLASVASAASPRTHNYDESKVPPFTLPDILTFSDGTKLKSPDEWPRRRREILRVFEKGMYGRMPPRPEKMEAVLLSSTNSCAGYAERRVYRQYFREGRQGPFIDWTVFRPSHIKGKVPFVIALNSIGSFHIVHDPDLMPADGWLGDDPEMRRRRLEGAAKIRGAWADPNSRHHWPINAILARGYAVVTACYMDISPDPSKKEDRATQWRKRCFELWPPWDEAAPDNTKALMAWAWGLCRGLDLVEAHEPTIDARRAVVTGCSRLGKAALIAGAFDERFPVVVPNQTGNGGAPLAKRYFGENIYTESQSFPHWFTRSYFAYANREAELPFDQHWLLACVAPRRLLVEGFDQPWFDTKGEYLACQAAGPVWEFLGLPGFPAKPFPPDYDTSCIGSHIGYVRRNLQHGLAAIDWKWMLDFADRAFTAGAGK